MRKHLQLCQGTRREAEPRRRRRQLSHGAAASPLPKTEQDNLISEHATSSFPVPAASFTRTLLNSPALNKLVSKRASDLH